MYNFQNTNEMVSGLHITLHYNVNMERWVRFLCHFGPKFKVQKIVELMWKFRDRAVKQKLWVDKYGPQIWFVFGLLVIGWYLD